MFLVSNDFDLTRFKQREQVKGQQFNQLVRHPQVSVIFSVIHASSSVSRWLASLYILTFIRLIKKSKCIWGNGSGEREWARRLRHWSPGGRCMLHCHCSRAMACITYWMPTLNLWTIEFDKFASFNLFISIYLFPQIFLFHYLNFTRYRSSFEYVTRVWWVDFLFVLISFDHEFNLPLSIQTPLTHKVTSGASTIMCYTKYSPPAHHAG